LITKHGDKLPDTPTIIDYPTMEESRNAIPVRSKSTTTPARVKLLPKPATPLVPEPIKPLPKPSIPLVPEPIKPLKKAADVNPSESRIVWARNPEDYARVYGSDPTYSLMTGRDGKVYNVRDILDQFNNRPVKHISPALWKKLQKLLDNPLWSDVNRRRVSPNQVLGDLDNPDYAEHKQRIENADLSYPLMLSEGGGVIDGAHRIAKAKSQNNDLPSLSFRQIAGTKKQLQPALLASPHKPNDRIIDEVVKRIVQIRDQKKEVFL
jgi:hypothetical protein